MMLVLIQCLVSPSNSLKNNTETHAVMNRHQFVECLLSISLSARDFLMHTHPLLFGSPSTDELSTALYCAASAEVSVRNITTFIRVDVRARTRGRVDLLFLLIKHLLTAPFH